MNAYEDMNFDKWRMKARELLQKGAYPNSSYWGQEPSFLFAFEEPRPSEKKAIKAPTVTKEFLELAQAVACARDEERWALLYRLLYRINHENVNLLRVLVDDDVRKVQLLAKSVHRDIHKMHAFVRFKKVMVEDQETYVAWHKPEHLILKLAAPFFVRRFGDKPWAIFTPDGSAHWNLQELTFSEGIPQNEFEHEDPFDEVWKTYYKSIFNPARLKIKAMKAEMAPKYWSSLPEAEIIRELIRDTPKRLQDMAEAPQYLAQIPKTYTWDELKDAAKKCAACPLASKATNTVFGEGPLNAQLMIVGEQPGNEEDLAGKSFVGPAGKVLAEALEKAGLSRDKVYITNAVKHFKWTPQESGGGNKARIHKKPAGNEMHACKPWLEAEISLIKPKVILALGATAGTALYGRLVQVGKERLHHNNKSAHAESLCVSWHPSSILRASSEQEANQRMQELVADLTQAARLSTN